MTILFSFGTVCWVAIVFTVIGFLFGASASRRATPAPKDGE